MRFVALMLLAASPLVAQEPMDASAWFNRGVADLKSANFPQAVADFQRAVQGDPANVTAHLNLATAWLQMYIPGSDSPDNRAVGDSAQREFLKVLELDPKNEPAMNYLGSLNLTQRKWDEAQAWYQKAVAAYPRDAAAWYSMGFIAWARWYPAEGAARASLGMRLEDPGPLPAGAVKADLITRYQTVIDGGLRDLHEALRIDPQYDDAMAYMNLLIRERADLADTADQYRQEIAEANAWVDKAMAVKKTKAGQRQSLGIGALPPPAPPPPPPPPGEGGGGGGDRAVPGRIRVPGDVMPGMLIQQEAPVYPPEARQAGILGRLSYR